MIADTNFVLAFLPDVPCLAFHKSQAPTVRKSAVKLTAGWFIGPVNLI